MATEGTAMHLPEPPLSDRERMLLNELDVWAASVKQVTDEQKYPTRNELIRALAADRRGQPSAEHGGKIDPPLLSRWLKGRRQLLDEPLRRLPGWKDTVAIATVVSRSDREAGQRLRQHGQQIALAERELRETDANWRARLRAEVVSPDVRTHSNTFIPTDSGSVISSEKMTAGPQESGAIRNPSRIRSWKTVGSLAAAGLLFVVLATAKLWPVPTQHHEEYQSHDDGDSTALQCGRYNEGPHAPVAFKPCIKRAKNALKMSVEVVSLQAVTEPVDVTVYVWLYDGSAYPRYRADHTLTICTREFTRPRQSKTCGPYEVRPPQDREGIYVAASTAELASDAAAFPRGWETFRATGPDPGFTGSQSGGLGWPH